MTIILPEPKGRLGRLKRKLYWNYGLPIERQVRKAKHKYSQKKYKIWEWNYRRKHHLPEGTPIFKAYRVPFQPFRLGDMSQLNQDHVTENGWTWSVNILGQVPRKDADAAATPTTSGRQDPTQRGV